MIILAASKSTKGNGAEEKRRTVKGGYVGKTVIVTKETLPVKCF